MKLIGTFQSNVHFYHRCCWELPPARRTIVGSDCRGKAKTFFVPFPYTYMNVRYSEINNHVIGPNLDVCFRPTPITPDDNKTYVIPMSNTDYARVCLGSAWNTNWTFPNKEELSQRMIETYFSSQFDGQTLFIPREEKLPLSSFSEWAKFQNFPGYQH